MRPSSHTTVTPSTSPLVILKAKACYSSSTSVLVVTRAKLYLPHSCGSEHIIRNLRFQRHYRHRRNDKSELREPHVRTKHLLFPNRSLIAYGCWAATVLYFPVRRQRSGEHRRERKVISGVPPRGSLVYPQIGVLG